MQVTIVGCAGSFPGPDSPASCYLIEAGDFRLVLDLGNGALGALQRYTALSDVDAICLSHLHADHCMDMLGYSVFQNYHPEGPQPPIPVYGPPGTADRLTLALGSQSKGVTEAFEFAELAPGTIEIGPLTMTTARMRHPIETFGFRIEHAGQVVVYSADTGPCDELVALARDADLLLAEASYVDGPDLPPDLHLTARQAAAYATRADVGCLVLTHLQPWNNRDDALAEAAAAYSGDLDIAAAGQEIHF